MPGLPKCCISSNMSFQELLKDTHPSRWTRKQNVYFKNVSSICYFENWISYQESPFFPFELDEDLNVNMEYSQHTFTYPYYHFNGERPDDYDLVHYDWFFANFWSVTHYAELSVQMLAKKGYFDPYYYTFEYGAYPQSLLGVSTVNIPDMIFLGSYRQIFGAAT